MQLNEALPSVDVNDVELSEDPRDDLPDGLLHLLDGVLVETLADEDDELLLDLLRVVERSEEGEDIGPGLTRLSSARPEPSVQALIDAIRELADAPGDEAVRGLAALWDLLQDYVALLTDREKMAGHLLLAHNITVGSNITLPEMLTTHAELRRQKDG